MYTKLHASAYFRSSSGYTKQPEDGLK